MKGLARKCLKHSKNSRICTLNVSFKKYQYSPGLQAGAIQDRAILLNEGLRVHFDSAQSDRHVERSRNMLTCN